MKIEKIEHMNGFQVIHQIPDITEEESEQMRQGILLKIYIDYHQPMKPRKERMANNPVSVLVCNDSIDINAKIEL